MRMTGARRFATYVVAGLCAVASSAADVHAQRKSAENYPQRPVRMLIPYTPGGTTDVVGRQLAQRLQDVFGVQFVIDNRPGASGAIATEIVARANPDGYTILLGTPGQLVTLPLLAPKVPYDAFADFTAVTKIVESPQVLFAHPKLPANNVPELVAYAKQRPGQINYGSVAVGGTGHLGMELLKQSTGIDMLHVPFKGMGPALTNLMSAQIQVMFSSLPGVLPHVKAQRVKILATGAAKRTPAIADVPTVAETIPGYELATWYGIYVPKRTPQPIVGRLHAELVKILTSAEIAQLFAAQGVEPAHSTTAELEEYMRKETERWRKVIAKAGLKFE